MKYEMLTAASMIAFLMATLPLAQASSPDAPPSTSSKGIAAVLQPFIENHSLAGAVTLVADKDKVLDIQAVGYADVAAKKPLKTDAVFWIASQTKAMTCAAVMMLVDEGKLTLDDPVEKYLPEYHDMWVAEEQDKDHMVLKRPTHAITVREILSHTSGLPFSTKIERPTLDRLPLWEAVHTYAMSTLQYQPGTRYQYSNAGINTGGRLVEVLSGMSYEAFMQKRLFDPLGMKDTTFWPNKEQIARLAKSYKPNAAKTDLEETAVTQLIYPLDSRNRYPMPAGGLFSTATDVLHFCQMLLNNGEFGGKRLLSEKAVAEMTRKQTGDTVTESYGLGLSVNGDSFGHGGAYSTNMNIDRRHNRIYLWMVQHAGYPNDGDQSQAAFRKAAAAQFPVGSE